MIELAPVSDVVRVVFIVAGLAVVLCAILLVVTTFYEMFIHDIKQIRDAARFQQWLREREIAHIDDPQAAPKWWWLGDDGEIVSYPDRDDPKQHIESERV